MNGERGADGQSITIRPQSAAWAVARKGWIPLWAALVFDAFMRWISAAFVIAHCDDCKRRIPRHGRKLLIVHFHAQPRVNGYRMWGFCSDACRARWFGAGAADDFHPIVDDWVVYDPTPFTSADGPVCVSIIHDDGPGRGAPGVALNDAHGNRKIAVTNGVLVASVVLESPQAVNAWWRTPAWLTDGIVEVVADHREAA